MNSIEKNRRLIFAKLCQRPRCMRFGTIWARARRACRRGAGARGTASAARSARGAASWLNAARHETARPLYPLQIILLILYMLKFRWMYVRRYFQNGSMYLNEIWHRCKIVWKNSKANYCFIFKLGRQSLVIP